MKSILRTLFALALFATLTVSAQSYRVVTVMSGGTNTVAASTTSAVNLPTAVSQQTDAGLQISLASTAGATGNVTFLLDRSVDGQTYETSPYFSITVAYNGTSTVTVFTNLDVRGVGTLRLKSIQTPATYAATNISVKLSQKFPFVSVRN